MQKEKQIHFNANATARANVAREKWLLEYSGLSNWPTGGPAGKRLNDCPNNTFRALRYVGQHPNSSFHGLGRNLLYTEFTSVDDWFYERVNFRELYEMDSDPYQLQNLYN